MIWVLQERAVDESCNCMDQRRRSKRWRRRRVCEKETDQIVLL